jgi:chaperone BCS1
MDLNIKRKVKSSGIGDDGMNNETDQQIHQIRLTIRKGSIHDLRVFIDNAIFEHQKHQEFLLSEKQYCFQFRQCVNMDDCLEVQWDEIEFQTYKTFENIFFEKKDELMSQIDFFMKNSAWYKKHGMPHHLGILLYGTPGCGKTSCIKVIAQLTGYSLIVINLNRIKSCRELETIFYSTSINKKNIPNDKRIYVFEDVDCLSSVVHERSTNHSATTSQCGEEDHEISIAKLASALMESKKPEDALPHEDKLSLSCILNLLDGIVETPGRIVIMTSNYPERIDAALKRPGRMDIHVEFKRATRTIMVEMLSSFYEISQTRILSEYAMELSQIREDYFSIAQVSNFCVINKHNIRNVLFALSE